jgi:hypothetical protein
VLGKRGEAGRVIVRFADDVRAGLRPGDHVSVRAEGQGLTVPEHPEVTVMNLAPSMLARLPVRTGNGALVLGVRCGLPSALVGNGVGRPSVAWDIDLQVHADTAHRWGADSMRLGDLVAVADIDARWNIGYRRGWMTVGIVVHGGSPLPGHGPGITPIFTGGPGTMVIDADPRAHQGVTARVIEEVADARPGVSR